MADNAVSTRPDGTLLRAGYVRKGHGVHGDVRVEPLGDDPSRFRAGLRLIREDSGEILTVRGVRSLGDGDVLLSFKELTTPEAVKVLAGTYLCVGREHARRLGNDEWFVSDLIGLEAVTESGHKLGTVTDVEAYPAHDVIVVGSGRSAQRFPMVKEFVLGVDLENGIMTLDPWEEL